MWAVRALNSCSRVNTGPLDAILEVDADFAKIDAFHSFASQRGTDRWTGGCLAGANDEFDHLVFLHRFSRHDGSG